MAGRNVAPAIIAVILTVILVSGFKSVAKEKKKNPDPCLMSLIKEFEKKCPQIKLSWSIINTNELHYVIKTNNGSTFIVEGQTSPIEATENLADMLGEDKSIVRKRCPKLQ